MDKKTKDFNLITSTDHVISHYQFGITTLKFSSSGAI